MVSGKVVTPARCRVAAILVSGITMTSVTSCHSGTATAPMSGATQPSAQTSMSAPSSTAMSIEDKARKDALTVYRGMWQDFVDAGATSDWRSPKLGQYATGTALTNMSRALYADHYNGLVTKGQPTFQPAVSSVDPPGDPRKIVVTDCADATRWLKYKADNGQLADDTPGGRHLVNAIVEKQSDGSWKVTEYGVHEVSTC